VSPKEVALNVATLDAKIPKALWKDLKAEGLLHQDAPVPR
jgi:D-threo-aldose 1-dehydrogenase